jgi:hypothetical protein
MKVNLWYKKSLPSGLPRSLSLRPITFTSDTKIYAAVQPSSLFTGGGIYFNNPVAQLMPGIHPVPNPL